MKHPHLAAVLALAFGSLLSVAPAANAADKIRVSKSEATTFAFAFLEVGAKEGILRQARDRGRNPRSGGRGESASGAARRQRRDRARRRHRADVCRQGLADEGRRDPGRPAARLRHHGRQGRRIHSVADLKGKLIGISTVGSLSDWLPTEISRRQGWGSDGIRRVALGSQDGLTAALLSHNVDGIIGGTQTGYRLEQAAAARSSRRSGR